MRDALRRTLRALGSESVRDALSGVLDSLPSLASELGKPAPTVRIDDNGYRLRGQAGGTLNNVFMHLLRNSMDHGIETAEARSAHGKTPAGTIDIEVGVDNGALQITLSDDGRGLALERIRGIAMERGWIGRDDTLSDEAIAEFHFPAGLLDCGNGHGVVGPRRRHGRRARLPQARERQHRTALHRRSQGRGVPSVPDDRLPAG